MSAMSGQRKATQRGWIEDDNDIAFAQQQPQPSAEVLERMRESVLETIEKNIPDTEKRPFLTAMKKCPNLVVAESDPARFLRIAIGASIFAANKNKDKKEQKKGDNDVENHQDVGETASAATAGDSRTSTNNDDKNPKEEEPPPSPHKQPPPNYTEENLLLAARRVVTFWEKRIELFGEERAFMPLNQTKRGALSPEDLEMLETGSLALLPNDTKGRKVILVSFGAGAGDTAEDRQVRFRCLFYLLYVASLSDRPCVFIRFATSPDFDKVRALKHVLPLRVQEIVLVYRPREGSMELFRTTVVPMVYNILSQRFPGKLSTVLSDQGEEICRQMEELGFQKRGLPEALGGLWTQEDHSAWLVRRLDQELRNEGTKPTNHRFRIAAADKTPKVTSKLKKPPPPSAPPPVAPAKVEAKAASSDPPPSSSPAPSEDKKKKAEEEPVLYPPERFAELDRKLAEIKRKRDAEYSRNRRKMKKIDEKTLRAEIEVLVKHGDDLKREHKRLASLVMQARNLVQYRMPYGGVPMAPGGVPVQTGDVPGMQQQVPPAQVPQMMPVVGDHNRGYGPPGFVCPPAAPVVAPPMFSQAYQMGGQSPPVNSVGGKSPPVYPAAARLPPVVGAKIETYAGVAASAFPLRGRSPPPYSKGGDQSPPVYPTAARLPPDVAGAETNAGSAASALNEELMEELRFLRRQRLKREERESAVSLLNDELVEELLLLRRQRLEKERRERERERERKRLQEAIVAERAAALHGRDVALDLLRSSKRQRTDPDSNSHNIYGEQTHERSTAAALSPSNNHRRIYDEQTRERSTAAALSPSNSHRRIYNEQTRERSTAAALSRRQPSFLDERSRYLEEEYEVTRERDSSMPSYLAGQASHGRVRAATTRGTDSPTPSFATSHASFSRNRAASSGRTDSSMASLLASQASHTRDRAGTSRGADSSMASFYTSQTPHSRAEDSRMQGTDPSIPSFLRSQVSHSRDGTTRRRGTDPFMSSILEDRPSRSRDGEPDTPTNALLEELLAERRLAYAAAAAADRRIKELVEKSNNPPSSPRPPHYH